MECGAINSGAETSCVTPDNGVVVDSMAGSDVEEAGVVAAAFGNNWSHFSSPSCQETVNHEIGNILSSETDQPRVGLIRRQLIVYWCSYYGVNGLIQPLTLEIRD